MRRAAKLESDQPPLIDEMIPRHPMRAPPPCHAGNNCPQGSADDHQSANDTIGLTPVLGIQKYTTDISQQTLTTEVIASQEWSARTLFQNRAILNRYNLKFMLRWHRASRGGIFT
jgi:hypothetical protein